MVAAEDVEVDMKTEDIPFLGVGLSFRAPFIQDVFKYQDKIGFLEIIADHYVDATREKTEELKLLCKHFTVIPHAINLSLGSTDGIDKNYLEKLASLVQRINPPYWSEHIAFSRSGGIEIGHLSPLPFSNRSIDTIAANVEQVKKLIKPPLILENISYLVDLPGHKMKETEFLKSVLDSTDAGLLLDITNLCYNSNNHNYDPEDFLNQIPLEKVVQLHFTGGIIQDGKFIDNHSKKTPEEVWSLMRKLLKRKMPKGLILERDDSNPDFDEILAEIDKAKSVIRETSEL